ncbi:hypothetical protein KUL118_52780 [Tenacibaculum sp. KUL118]|nr:hypothetical protein KUL118_52780 [Tenacibaculum sp. KUL118]
MLPVATTLFKIFAMFGNSKRKNQKPSAIAIVEKSAQKPLIIFILQNVIG